MKHPIVTLLTLPAMILLIHVDLGRAARGPLRSMKAVRTDSPPVIDGKIDESCWSTADAVTDFTDYKLERLAVEQTIVRVLYDDENVYIAFECLEPDPNSIVAVERKYDLSLREEDSATVRFDTFHDHRCTYIFAVNTLGTRYDARMGLFDYYDDETWGCDWTAACTVEEDRWFAEMAIPICNMLFDRRDGVTWGANFYRREKGLQERSYWCYRNSRARYPAEYGHLTNLDLANVSLNRRPAFEVYGSATADFEDNSTKLSTGLDISMRLNSELTSAFTINPDFGQVEADPDTIELRDTERFLAERRPFFREGNEIFGTPINVYYSRRLTDIDLGAKVTGQGRNWTLGLLDVQGEIVRDDLDLDGNYHVGRFFHNIGENSHIGGIWANSAREDGSNFTGGLDTRLFLDSTTSITTQFLGLTDSDGIETDGQIDKDAYAGIVSLSGGTNPLYWRAHFLDISRGFEPDLGYVPRRNIRGPGSYLRYRGYYDEGPLKSIGAISEIEFYENDDHDTVLRDFMEGAGVGFHNEVEFWYIRSDRFHAPFQNYSDRIRIEYNEDVDIWDSISGSVAKGVWEEEPYHEYSIEKPMRITDRLVTTFDGNFRVTEPVTGGRENVWLWRWVTQYNFVWNARIKFTAEQTSEDRHNLTMLFSWPMNLNTDFYVLLNDYEVNGEEVRAAFVKLVYRF
ncbi:MAG: carbohydrate binding family 9 domain-containing protein [Planctomycetota bacterium]